MSKIGAIEAEIQKALSTAQGKKEKRPAYLTRLVEGLAELPSEDWDKLSQPAQEWQVAGQKALNADADAPDFEDAETETTEETAEADPSNEKEDEKVSTKKSTKKKEAPAAKAPAKDAKKPATKKAAASGKGGRGVKGDGYKGHRVGSNKEAVHKVFDDKGAEAAVKAAVKAGIKEGSAKSWISSWGGGKAKKK